MLPMIGLPFVDLKIVLFYKRSLGLQRVRLTLTSAAQRYAPSECNALVE